MTPTMIDVPILPILCPRCTSLLEAGTLPFAIAPLPGGRVLAAYCPEQSVGLLLVELPGHPARWHSVSPVAPEGWVDMASGWVTTLRAALEARAAPPAGAGAPN